MKLDAQAESRVRELLAEGALPASRCGAAFLRLVAPLLQAGVLRWERSGAGRHLAVQDLAVLRDFWARRFPGAAPPRDFGGRVAAVGKFRDSKALANAGSEILSVRAWNDQALLKNGRAAGAAKATADHGVFSFLLSPDSDYQPNGRWLLVENPAVFTAAEHLPVNADAVIYGGGRASTRVLSWLVRHAPEGFVLLHLPDYDPVGLSDFIRLQRVLGEQASLFVPADLEARFARFSNPALLQRRNSQNLLVSLRLCSLPHVREVTALIDRHNAGLEQEALLLELPLPDANAS